MKHFSTFIERSLPQEDEREMSEVTSIMILCGPSPINESAAISYLDQHMQDNGCGYFCEVSEHSGGCKAFVPSVYLTGTNYLDLDKFKDAVANAPWVNPDPVRILIWSPDHERPEQCNPLWLKMELDPNTVKCLSCGSKTNEPVHDHWVPNADWTKWLCRPCHHELATKQEFQRLREENAELKAKLSGGKVP